jgi:cytochrome P450
LDRSKLTYLSGAGADTTSIAIRACIHAICSRKAVYDRLQAEIDEYYDKSELTQPITYLQCQNLPYLIAVTREAMRLLPSIVYQLLRHAPEAGLTVDGKFIPPGTPVGMSPIAQNRDPKIWGDDAEEFRPERWLESEAKFRYMESNNMTFGGSGPRMCVGRNIALVRSDPSMTLFTACQFLDVDLTTRRWRSINRSLNL